MNEKPSKISFLCVTEARQEFMPWLFWNYGRVNWPETELIVIDSSERPLPASKRKPVDLYHHVPGANVPAKRNMAMMAATGDFVTWLDDDDWRHPNWAHDVMNVMVPMNEAMGPVNIAGGRVSWFVNLFAPECRRFVQRRGILFASLLAATAVAKTVPFDERLERGSDLDWMARLLHGRGIAFTYDSPSLFLCHDRNLGNSHFVHQFNRPLTELVDEIGDAWGETGEQISQLADRLKNGN